MFLGQEEAVVFQMGFATNALNMPSLFDHVCVFCTLLLKIVLFFDTIAYCTSLQYYIETSTSIFFIVMK